jgi:signal peptidase I
MPAKSIFINVLSWFWTISFGIVMLLLILKFVVFQQVNVVGPSMQPNYYTGDLLFVNQIDKNFRRGQVVAVYEDRNVAKNADYFTRFQAKFYLKRIIALPGEEVEILGDKVIIYNKENANGAILEEKYMGQEIIRQEKENCQNNLNSCYFAKIKIPNNEYFLLGDNRVQSSDSRALGPFPDYALFGQEALRFWPFDRKEIFNLPDYKWVPLDSQTKTRIEEFKKMRLVSIVQQ